MPQAFTAPEKSAMSVRTDALAHRKRKRNTAWRLQDPSVPLGCISLELERAIASGHTFAWLSTLDGAATPSASLIISFRQNMRAMSSERPGLRSPFTRRCQCTRIPRRSVALSVSRDRRMPGSGTVHHAKGRHNRTERHRRRDRSVFCQANILGVRDCQAAA
ncbi:hypothetical protein BC835DRAFT_586272 [Cytidiella melzeri]|nr:hypothetical protein BC835DRAFT_586272 [Cytidiella melzeri]